MSISPDIVCERYADKRVKVTLRPLHGAEDVLLIEGAGRSIAKIS